MSVEKRLIELIDGILPKDPASPARCFEADSQFFTLNGSSLVFTTDGFSREDLLQETNPYCLGWNVAVGAISDILACGGVPLFYAHAMSIGPGWDEKFLVRFSRGIAKALEISGITFIGGDLGRTDEWKYCASVIGRLEGRQVLRKGAAAGDIIYLSGRVGAGNLEAAVSLSSRKKGGAAPATSMANRFCLRLSEARLMSRYATSAIDTSDGVFDALNTISEINGTGYVIEQLPYLSRGVRVAHLLSLPKSLLFFGGCGEYELLFTINEEAETAFLTEARTEGLRFYRLGRIAGGTLPRKILKEDGVLIDLSSGVNIAARDFRTTEEYLEKLQEMVEALRCHGESSSQASG
jgi:thiamine-monophosphate kinase